MLSYHRSAALSYIALPGRRPCPPTAVCFEPRYARRAERMKASEIRELLKLLDRPGIISFAGGIPDPALFPAEAAAEAYRRALTHSPALALQYSVSEGYLPLREWIAGHMHCARRPGRAGQHRRHQRLAAGPRLSRQAPDLAGRHGAGDGALLSRRAAGLLRLRAALRRDPSRARQPDARILRRRRRFRRRGDAGEARLRRAGFRQPDRRNPVDGRPGEPARAGAGPRHSADRGLRLSGAALRGREPADPAGAGRSARRLARRLARHPSRHVLEDDRARPARRLGLRVARHRPPPRPDQAGERPQRAARQPDGDGEARR